MSTNGVEVKRRSSNEFIKDDAKVEEWLKSYRVEKSRKVISRIFNAWVRWLNTSGGGLAGKTPTDLARMQNELNRKAFRDDDTNNRIILDFLMDYLESLKASTTGHRKKVFYSVRSFFEYHAKRSGGFPKVLNGQRQVFKGGSIRPVDQDKFSQILSDIVGKPNEVYKAIFGIMAVSGMGIGEIVEFSELGVDAVREMLAHTITRNGEEIMEVPLNSRKGNIDKEYFTYIGGRPLQWLREWVRVGGGRDEKIANSQKGRVGAREKGKAVGDEVFITDWFSPVSVEVISEYWKNSLVQLKYYKVQKGQGRKRTGSNAHLIRHYFQTNFVSSGASREFGDFFMGHFEPLPYNEIYQNRERRINQYLTALPTLDIWTERGQSEKEQVWEAERKRLLAESEDMRKELKKVQASRVAEIEVQDSRVAELEADNVKIKAEFERLARLVEAMAEEKKNN